MPCHRGVATMEADVAYYKRRTAQETAAANAALDRKVRQVHLELARRYGERISALEHREVAQQLHLVASL